MCKSLQMFNACVVQPHADSQAMDRAHRLGQKKNVVVYRLLTANNVEIDMMEKQISKKMLDRMTMVGGQFSKAGRRSSGSEVVDPSSGVVRGV